MKTTTKTYSMPPAIADAVKARAVELGVPESTIARWAFEQFLNLRTIDVSIGRPTRKGRK